MMMGFAVTGSHTILHQKLLTPSRKSSVTPLASDRPRANCHNHQALLRHHARFREGRHPVVLARQMQGNPLYHH
jgi:hypothetical protein